MADASRRALTGAPQHEVCICFSVTKPHPCNFDFAGSAMVVDTAADGRPAHPGAACEPDPQLGSPSVIPSPSPNSRRGRRKCASPIRQGRVEMDTLYVGIDVSKDRLDVHVHPDGEVFVCARNADGLDDLITRLKSLDLAIVAIEATGGYETVAAAALGAAGLPVVVVNPAQVRAFARALGARAKTDPIDAGVIARFAEAIKPKLRTLPDAQSQLLAGFVARRRQIIQMMTAEKQRHATGNGFPAETQPYSLD